MSDKEKTSDTDNLTLKDFMPDVSKGYMAIAGTKLEGKSDKADDISFLICSGLQMTPFYGSS